MSAFPIFSSTHPNTFSHPPKNTHPDLKKCMKRVKRDIYQQNNTFFKRTPTNPNNHKPSRIRAIKNTH